MVEEKTRLRVADDGSLVHVSGPPPMMEVDQLEPYAYAGQSAYSNHAHSIFDGAKFAGGFGETQLYELDYWTMRQRSSQIFTENLYARGLIRRLVTNEINTGLTPESCPDDAILNMSEDALNDWTEIVETRFGIWGKSPNICDHKGRDTFGAIQRAARMEALISGDVLVVMHQDRKTGLPRIELVSGDAVQSPLGGRDAVREGHTVKHGVELNARGKVMAHWVRQPDGDSKRIPAFGEKSGRRISWLVYGCEKRLDEVRGMPLLAIVLQSLKEIDRYRDAAQRKAVVNSILAMYIKKGEDKPGTLPVSGGVKRRDAVANAGGANTPRNFNLAGQVPGLVYEELQQGEEPVGFNSAGVDIDFARFEEAIIQAVAWANEMPPEILRLAFSSNYSASQAAINEFKIYLNKVWSDFGENFCTPIYAHWLLMENLKGRIQADGFFESYNDPEQYDVYGAWVSVDWYGSIKPSTDMLKQVKGSDLLVDGGYSTRSRESRITTGTKFSKNAKRLKRENELWVEARRPIAEFQQEFGLNQDHSAAAGGGEPVALNESEVVALVQEQIDAGADADFIAGFMEELACVY